MFQLKHSIFIGVICLSLFSMIVLPVPSSKGAQAAPVLKPPFGLPVSYPVGTDPFGIVAGNLRGGGLQDLAVTNEMDSTVTILLNNGTGTFIPQPPISVGSNPLGIVAGDFTGSGHQDLAVTSIGNNTVSILLNNGNGLFTLQPPIRVGLDPVGIAVGDFRGLGYQDLAVTNEVSNTVSILRNNGHGTFSPQPPIPVGHNPLGIVVGDFTGLGHHDLAITNTNDNTVNILANNGNGIFTLQAPIPVGRGPETLVAGDFTGLGHHDLAITNTNENTISILANNGHGIFTSHPPIPVGNSPRGITTGDFMGVEHTDLAVTNAVDDTVLILANNGSGIFTPQPPLSMGSNPIGIAVGNFTQPNQQELAIANFNDNTISILVNTPTATPTPTPTPTLEPTVTPTPTLEPTATPTPTAVAPDLAMSMASVTGNHFHVGDKVTFVLLVTNPSEAKTLTNQRNIFVTDILPLGLRNIRAHGSFWQIWRSNTTSPALLTAHFTRFDPIGPGTVLPPIVVSGELTSDAIPTFTNAAQVTIPGDVNPRNNVATYTVNVENVSTPTPNPTPVSNPTPTPMTLPTPNPRPVADTPDLAMLIASVNGDHFSVGDKVIFVLRVMNASRKMILTRDISVTDILPAGLCNIRIQGSFWQIQRSNTASPALLTAHFARLDSIGPGRALPPIIVSGELTSDAIPTFTTTAQVTIPGDINPDNNIATYTVNVENELTSIPTWSVIPPQVADNDHHHHDHHHGDHHHHNHHHRDHYHDDYHHGRDSYSYGENSGNYYPALPVSIPGLPATGGSPCISVGKNERS